MTEFSITNKMKRMIDHWSNIPQHSQEDSSKAISFPPKRWVRSDNLLDTQIKRYGSRYTTYRNDLQRAIAREFVPEYPIHIDFDLVDTCNLSCVNCSENYRPWSNAKLDLDIVFNDPLFSKPGLLPSVDLGNTTEPFLDPNAVFRAVDFFLSRDVMDIWFHTNGTLLTPEIIEQLIDREVTWVSISVDAFSAETYQTVRGKGHDNVMTAIHTLVKRRSERNSVFPLIRLSYVALPENLHEMQAFHDYWKPYVDMIEFQTFVLLNPLGAAYRPHVADDARFRHVDAAHCSDIFWRMAVGPKSDVAPCCVSYGLLDKDVTLGKLGEDGNTLLNMWNGQRFRALRAQHLSAEGPDISACRQCRSQIYTLKAWDD